VRESGTSVAGHRPLGGLGVLGRVRG
jgi:hypothetical protein